MAESKQLLSIKKKRTIGAGQTVVADSLPLSRFTCLDYSLCYKEVGGSKAQSLKVSAQKVDADIEETNFAFIGSLAVENELFIVGSNAELQIVNNEAFDVELVFIRTKI